MPKGPVAIAVLLLAAACGGSSSSSPPTPPPAAPVAVQLTFTAQPVSATSQSSLAPSVKVEVRDGSGARVAGSTAPVTLALGLGAGNALAGTLTVAAVDGVATFSDLSLAKAGFYTLVATSGTLAGATSAVFTVYPGPAVGLVFTAQPGSSTGGATLAPAVTVELRDAAGNRSSSNATVTLALRGGTGGATLAGTTSTAAVAGEATFSDLAVDRAAAGYQLRATALVTLLADSASFNVAVGPAVRLSFTSQPTATRTTVALSPAVAVAVLDAGGNVVTGATPTVTLSLASGPAWATLAGASTAAVGGVASFAALAVDTAGSYTLQARATGLLAATSASFSTSDAWTPMGPEGGYLQKIAVHPTSPTTLFAAVGPAGLWTSGNAAASWTQVPLPRKAPIDGVLFTPGVAGQMWAWGSGGVWYSTDGGTTWSDRSPPLQSVYRVQVEPGTGVAFATGFTGSAYALLHSADAGLSWAPISPALPAGASPSTLGMSPGRVLWVNTSSGLYRLASGGGAWSAAATGLPSGPIYAFAFHPTNPLVAWAGTYSNVYVTGDGGATWTQQLLNGSSVFDVLVDKAAPAVLYAATYGSGVWRSPDSGVTWAPTGALAAYSLNALAGSGAAVYAGSESGVFKSSDGGASWVRSSAGLRAATPYSLAVQPGATGTILAAGYGEMFRTTDGGASWSRKQQTPGGFIRRLAFDPDLPAHAFAAADYSGVLRSPDAGLTWTPATGISGFVQELAVGGGSPRVVWATTTTPVGLFRSVDGGATFTKVWTVTATVSLNGLAADPGSALVAYAGYADSASAATSGIYKTIDGGVSWNLLAGSPQAYANSRLEAVAGSPQVLWLDASGDYYRTANGGGIWTHVTPVSPPGQLWGTGVDPTNPLRCFIGSASSGALVTADAGATWTPLLRGLPGEVDRLVVDPADPLVVYALTGAGLYRSTSGGF